MNKTLGRILMVVFFLGLGLFLVWLITHNLTDQQWKRIKEVFREADYWILIPVFLIGALSHLLRALRWRLFFQPLGYKPRVLPTFCAVMIGYLANLALPRMGEISRCGVLSRNERIPFNSVLGTMIAERVIDLICLAALLLLAILIQIDVVGRFFFDMIGVKISRLFHRENIAAGLGILAGMLVLGIILWLIIKKFKLTRWFRKLKLLIYGIQKGIFSIKRINKKKLFFAYTFGIWLCYFLMVYIGFYCLKPTAELGFKPALSILGFGSIGMIATQGGIGAYQLIVEKVLDLYGIAEAYGYAFGWLSWLTQTLLTLVLGFGAMATIPFLHKKAGKQTTPVHYPEK